jgi:hypothetical protein
LPSSLLRELHGTGRIYRIKEKGHKYPKNPVNPVKITG